MGYLKDYALAPAPSVWGRHRASCGWDGKQWSPRGSRRDSSEAASIDTCKHIARPKTYGQIRPDFLLLHICRQKRTPPVCRHAEHMGKCPKFEPPTSNMVYHPLTSINYRCFMMFSFVTIFLFFPVAVWFKAHPPCLPEPWLFAPSAVCGL